MAQTSAPWNRSADVGEVEPATPCRSPQTNTNTTSYPACKACGSTTNEHRVDKRMRSGWSSNCKPCMNAASLAWKAANHERQLETTKAWREANPDRVKATRAKSADKERAAALKWRADNIERARANDRAFRANNPEKARLKAALRHERMKNAIDEKVTPEHISELREDQGNRCAYCDCDLAQSGDHIDHFEPISKGGRHARHNLVLACPTCNLKKGAKAPLEFLEATGKVKKNTEAREQSLVVIWSHKKAVRDLMPALAYLHHSPNGEKRDVRTGNKLKAMGVKPGFPDLILPAWSATRTHPGLVIEMKTATGRESEPQKEWAAHFIAQGWQHRLARSAQEAREHLCRYLGTTPASAPPLD